MESSASSSLRLLAHTFAQVTDPRRKRGIRHPFAGILALTFLGLLARIREFAQLQFWASEHWDQLREPLGFERDKPPHATTFSRVLTKFSVAEFQQAFRQWMLEIVPCNQDLGVVAVDGKTCCQGHGADGQPIHVLSVFSQQLKVVLAQWEMHAEQTNEPTLLLNHLKQLLTDYPMLELLTGDAIYAQRNLAELLQSEECDYLFQVKANQGDLYDALQQTFANHDHTPADVVVHEKKVDAAKLVGCGVTWTMPSIAASNSASPTAKSPSAWSVWSQPKGDRLLVVM